MNSKIAYLVVVLLACLATVSNPAFAQTNFTVLKSFTSVPDGNVPYAGLAYDTNGLFYGTTASGGISNAGTIFSLDKNGYGYKASSGYKTLFNFFTTNGVVPYAKLLLASDGCLYGTTYAGGISNSGTVFKINRDGSGFAVLHSFTGTTDGKNPETGLVEGTDGALYGTTYFSDSVTRGTIFKINKDGGGYVVLHAFTGNPDGQQPTGKLLKGSDGALYGTTGFGGSHGRGIVFTINNDGSVYNAIYIFGSITGDGGQPLGGVIEGSDNVLYGTTYHSGGTGYDGTIYKLNKDGGSYQVLHRFSTAGGDGQRGSGELLEGADGALYGATDSSVNANGSIFKLNKDGNGYQLLRLFTGTAGDGSSPRCALTQTGDGVLYGTTQFGAVGGAGCVFALSDSVLPSHALFVATSSNSNLVQFFTTAATRYDVQRSTNLYSWSTLTTVTSPPSCLVIYTDQVPPRASGYYRLQQH